MAIRDLAASPRVLPLYARAAAPLLPGASLLPGVPGGGKEIPDSELRLDDVRVDRTRLARYARVCGFSLRDTLPATYPHVLAFPLHMALMSQGDFPFGAVGLVHVANEISQRRPIGLAEPLELRVRATPLEPHPKGRTFTIVSEARVEGELVWEDRSTMLRRGGGTGDGEKQGGGGKAPRAPQTHAEWRLPGDLGRRYAAVSGDRNPIHLHAVTARAFGFPKAIAHGMWTKARCLAALGSRVPDAFTVDVAFKTPLLIPGTAAFGSSAVDDDIRFTVRNPRSDAPHLDGRISP